MLHQGKRVLSEKKVIVIYIITTIVFFGLLFSTDMRATNQPLSDALNFSKITSIQKEDTSLNKDSVIYYTRGANGLIVMPPSDWEPFPYNVKFRDTVIYNPAYLPIVFDGKILPSGLDFTTKDTLSNKKKEFRLIPKNETFAPQIERIQKTKDLRRDYYTNMNNIRNIKYSVSRLKEAPQIDQEGATKRNILNELITPDEPIQISPVTLPKLAPEYIYWIKNGEHSLQIAQNYISENWHKGGNSSFFVRNFHKFMLNYVKGKVIFENTLEWKLNLQRTPADTVNKINISEDLVRLSNKFKYKAIDNWSYSANLETRTQLFNSYPINSEKLNTGFLTPLNVTFGLGMDFTLNKKFEKDKAKKIKFSQSLSPLSLNYIFVNKFDDVDETRFNVEKGKHSKFEVGSLFLSELTFNFNRYMSWYSRLRYYTNYHRGELDFENKFDMALNRYLSTTISCYLRFDDNVAKNDDWDYFQMNELISFGLTYKW